MKYFVLLFFFANIINLSAQETSQPPNIVLLLVDDLGWRDIGPYGQKLIDTPNIDQLARDGIRYTQAYSNAPVCSPSRVSILTGKNPARLHYTGHITSIGRHRYPEKGPFIPPNNRMDLPLEEQTLAELLKPAGYVSASIGKWHVGHEGFWPLEQGFDLNIGGWTHGSPPSYFHPYTKAGQDWNDSIVNISGGKDGDYLTDRLTDEGIKFIEANRERPFFLYLTHYGVHVPLEAPQDLVEKYQKRYEGIDSRIDPTYAAMVENMDQNIGRVIASLKEQGLEENTLFILYSDNGGLASVTDNRPLRDGKGHTYEGGIRVPLIMKWPGRIEANTTNDTPVIGSDLLPTFAAVTHQVPEQADALDGRDLTGTWVGNNDIGRDTLYWYYPHYHEASMHPAGVIRQGRYKLMEFYDPVGVIELYDLEADPSETTNIADAHPEMVETLLGKLHSYLKSVDTIMHTPNPNAG